MVASDSHEREVLMPTMGVSRLYTGGDPGAVEWQNGRMAEHAEGAERRWLTCDMVLT